MADPSSPTSLSGTRSTEEVRDDGQTDFFSSLWAPIARILPPERTERDTLARDELQLAGEKLVVRYVRHVRARRYRLLFRRDGTARCTVPRRGTLREARRFVLSNQTWLTERIRRHQADPPRNQPLRPGDRVWVQGVEASLIVDTESGTGRLGEVVVPLDLKENDLRPAVERALRRFAATHLPDRTRALAVKHGLEARLSRISVRNQRTRWGSCSARGQISLNWRLIQVPPSVCDYVIQHEIAHLVHLNHSTRFWELVRTLCPDYPTAEAWLKRSGRTVL